MRKFSLLSVTFLFAFCLTASLAQANSFSATGTARSSVKAASQFLSSPQASLPTSLHVRNADLTRPAPADTDLNGLVKFRAVTPEPASLILVGSGLLAIALLLRKRLPVNSL